MNERGREAECLVVVWFFVWFGFIKTVHFLKIFFKLQHYSFQYLIIWSFKAKAERKNSLKAILV